MNPITEEDRKRGVYIVISPKQIREILAAQKRTDEWSFFADISAPKYDTESGRMQISSSSIKPQTDWIDEQRKKEVAEQRKKEDKTAPHDSENCEFCQRDEARDMEEEFAEETERETSDDLETRAEREMEARDEAIDTEDFEVSSISNFEADMADKATETYYTKNFTEAGAYSPKNEDCSLCVEIKTAQEAEGPSDSEIQAQREREIQEGKRTRCCGCKSARGRQECEDCDCHIDAYNEDRYERMAGQDYEPPTYDGPY